LVRVPALSHRPVAAFVDRELRVDERAVVLDEPVDTVEAAALSSAVKARIRSRSGMNPSAFRRSRLATN
jgi:hypothetical protein